MLVYRWLLTSLSYELLQLEENSHIDQLELILNKQSDGIALIDQTKEHETPAEKKVNTSRTAESLYRSSKYVISEKDSVQYLNLKFCNDALAEIVQC